MGEQEAGAENLTWLRQRAPHGCHGSFACSSRDQSGHQHKAFLVVVLQHRCVVVRGAEPVRLDRLALYALGSSAGSTPSCRYMYRCSSRLGMCSWRAAVKMATQRGDASVDLAHMGRWSPLCCAGEL